MKVQTPKYANYSDLETRRETYSNWVRSMKQNPQECAEAGFFYINRGDKLVCYHCGIGIKNWEDTDNPWEEHLRWSPDCYHAKNIGRVNVQNMEAQNPSAPAGPIIFNNNTVQVPSSGQVVPKCLKCGENKPDIIVLPCLHLNICNNCYPSVPTCLTCHKDRKGVQRIFFL